MAQRVIKQVEARKAAYRRVVWKGRHMNYECVLCPYATLEPMRMAEHLRVVHGRELAGGRPQTGAESRSPGGADEAATEEAVENSDEVKTR